MNKQAIDTIPTPSGEKAARRVRPMAWIGVVLWLAGLLLWLRSLAAPSKTDRFLVFGPQGDRQAVRAPVEAEQQQPPVRAVAR